MSNAAANAHVYTVDMEMEEYTRYLRMLPPDLARFVEFESSTSLNPKDIVDFKRESFMPWDYISNYVKEFSVSNHRDAFGGVHPRLDPVRRVW